MHSAVGLLNLETGVIHSKKKKKIIVSGDGINRDQGISNAKPNVQIHNVFLVSVCKWNHILIPSVTVLRGAAGERICAFLLLLIIL